MDRDGSKNSFWQKNDKRHENSGIEKHSYDVIIIGAGITGITLGFSLQQTGKKCLILESHEPGFGTTGGTTAHINNFYDSSYDEVISNFGEENAVLLADQTKETLRMIKRNVEKLQLKCDYSECNFYLFSTDEKQSKLLQNIYEAHQKVGIDTREAYEIPFPLKFEKAIEISGQAQFNPLKYITGLLKEFQRLGGILLTEKPVEKYSKDQPGNITVSCANGEQFMAQHLVWATHIPPGNNRFNLLVSPYRSYALAAELSHEPKKIAQTADLYDPYHYFRYHRQNGKYYLIAGGFDHKTGHEEDTEKPFDDLRKMIEENFKVKEVVSEWSSQYYVPADGLPYIGKMPGEENVYISTGYNGNGMTFGSMASLIIPDLIEGKTTPLSELLSPSRVKPLASAKAVIQENADAVKHMIADKFKKEKINDLDELEADTGKIISFEGNSVAAYKSPEGEIYCLNPVCPHMGCNVAWNTAEKSWDCPCHGSRFSYDGTLLNGPATENLTKI